MLQSGQLLRPYVNYSLSPVAVFQDEAYFGLDCSRVCYKKLPVGVVRDRHVLFSTDFAEHHISYYR
jgi:hypothetical protein